MLFGNMLAAPKWIVAFLGNPGLKYENTRHNAGFMTADALCAEKHTRIDRLRFKSLTATCTMGDDKVLLMKPQTFMNNSGEAIAEAARYYKIPADHIIVVSDEMSLAPGRIRVKSKGSAGGHNGLKSIISCLGTDAFPRIRLGVGAPPHPDYSIVDWVLGKFTGKDAEQMASSAKRAAAAVECYITRGADKAMSEYNRNVSET